MVVTSRIIRGSRRREPDPMAPRLKFQSRNPNSPGPSGRAAIQPLIPGRAASAAGGLSFKMLSQAGPPVVGLSVIRVPAFPHTVTKLLDRAPHPFSQVGVPPDKL